MSEAKVILDLCGGTGSWSKPYSEAGYEVHNITLPEFDVRTWEGYRDLKVHGILAAPPCTMFSLARNRYDKTMPRDFQGALSVVDACLRVIWFCRPEWWALENPQGLLVRWLGQPKMRFDPKDYGDPYTKRTCLWGKFCPPGKWYPARLTALEVQRSKVNSMAKYPRLTEIADITSGSQKERRAMTPPGFAKAFFEANP